MTFLFITDDEELADKTKEMILLKEKTAKIYISDFSEKSMKKTVKHFDKLSLCIFYSSNSDNFDSENLSRLNALCGYLLAINVSVYTNIKMLKTAAFFPHSEVIYKDSYDSLSKAVTDSYAKIELSDQKRTAKRTLLEKGIPVTPDCFAYYIQKNKPEIFDLFINAGIDVNSRDETGTPMINVAVRNDNENFVKKLMELGADINAVSEDRGYTPVMDAVWRGNEELTKLFIAHKADLNTISKEGQNNLVLAVGADRDKIVQLLAENGADPDVPDMMGMTAYEYATLFKKEKIVEILRPFHKAYLI